MSFAQFLPLFFFVILGVAMLLYVLLDGFDLGIGLLLPLAPNAEKDSMVASIGPFWDANETWLVLGVGILLIAFPQAHGQILGALYLPVTAMLIGLILRGVAFDFRVKARDHHKRLWNLNFFAGSLIATLAQGWMLGRYVTGFGQGTGHHAFALLITLTLPAAYVMLGGCWLLLKSEGDLQEKARCWARRSLVPVALGLLLISLATPWVSETVRERWFTMPAFLALLPIPLICVLALAGLAWVLQRPRVREEFAWLPFVLAIVILLMGFFGLAYSLYPYVIMDRMTLWDAAASTPALTVIFIGTVITVPVILGYTAFSYWVFRGKSTPLTYG
ncbi:MAG: cytochrome BD ubiquinol oxidase subunit II [Candidatus Dactylopiibacterium carminicum]|uniref:Cytochrome BD ubiquinol oxidase subunit II n=1 Tax=Candidatus Dactylopiibacterium carminicum TaxID=857335 RepID=A0A272EZ62_9RHOO|nr:cytochrome d ubiquinol oxidase subunit II [Candidatus Dactylopiibacterium carminicum]KAF7598051.1 cytochrome BD ubiquinol oxidase subunit II [Candidatus Dactylopiibacterium carminicum]PAS95401.1 MAG: cytochrome BD ubiquinol oxidase subunit II [Candidatus Dactylopiibacterium carminicum]PAS96458.1 MAG: cytochrome BD ubiquinol oxidase subunit II [Candidatus Dactylopiibacterium carminicum]PAS98588.1 MAG: cytochrome BD ubiquinol oxidase subunit II [Candidatus Dactylopiibacterium carminicum]